MKKITETQETEQQNTLPNSITSLNITTTEQVEHRIIDGRGGLSLKIVCGVECYLCTIKVFW